MGTENGNVIILGETMVHCSRQTCTYFEAMSCDEGKTFLQDEACDSDDGGGGSGLAVKNQIAKTTSGVRKELIDEKRV